MTVRASCETLRGRGALRRLRARGAAYLVALGRADAELSILLVSDRRIRTLNREWRGKDAATDVLSFPQSEPPGYGPLLGDVVISFDTAARRARTEARPVGVELDRYLAHGLLHLLGFDHERPEDARRMAEWEGRLARAEGLVGAALRAGRGGRTGAGGGWIPTRTSTSTRSPSGSTAPGTRARSSRGGSAR